MHVYVHRYTTSFCTAAKEEYAGLVVHLLDPSGSVKTPTGLHRIVCVNVDHKAGVVKSMARALQLNSEAGSCLCHGCHANITAAAAVCYTVIKPDG